MHARGINEDHLPAGDSLSFRDVDDAFYAVPSGLRLGTDDG